MPISISQIIDKGVDILQQYLHGLLNFLWAIWTDVHLDIWRGDMHKFYRFHKSNRFYRVIQKVCELYCTLSAIYLLSTHPVTVWFRVNPSEDYFNRVVLGITHNYAGEQYTWSVSRYIYWISTYISTQYYLHISTGLRLHEVGACWLPGTHMGPGHCQPLEGGLQLGQGAQQQIIFLG